MTIREAVGVPFRFVFCVFGVLLNLVMDPHDKSGWNWYWIKTGRHAREVTLGSGRYFA